MHLTIFIKNTLTVAFMLKIIKATLQEIVDRQDVGINVGINAATREEKCPVFTKSPQTFFPDSVTMIVYSQLSRPVRLVSEAGMVDCQILKGGHMHQ